MGSKTARLDSKTALARESVNCVQSKFYGVYQLLTFKAHRLYGAGLEEVLAKDPMNAYTVLKNLVENCTMSLLIFRECIARLWKVESEEIQ